jgi:hypothetical protein
VWTVTNNLNNVSGAKVVAKLPAYISWNNVISPTSENISYDSVAGEVVWNVGTVPAETGFAKPKKEVSFQLMFKPSVTQVGTSPNIIYDQVLTGTDNYSDAQVTDKRNSLNTRLVNDPGFVSNNERVVE